MVYFEYNKKNNTLYINSLLLEIPKKNPTIKEKMEYNNKPILDRINQSRYKEKILLEISKYKDCKISEFIEINF